MMKKTNILNLLLALVLSSSCAKDSDNTNEGDSATNAQTPAGEQSGEGQLSTSETTKIVIERLIETEFPPITGDAANASVTVSPINSFSDITNGSPLGSSFEIDVTDSEGNPADNVDPYNVTILGEQAEIVDFSKIVILVRIAGEDRVFYIANDQLTYTQLDGYYAIEFELAEAIIEFTTFELEDPNTLPPEVLPLPDPENPGGGGGGSGGEGSNPDAPTQLAENFDLFWTTQNNFFTTTDRVGSWETGGNHEQLITGGNITHIAASLDSSGVTHLCARKDIGGDVEYHQKDGTWSKVTGTFGNTTTNDFVDGFLLDGRFYCYFSTVGVIKEAYHDGSAYGVSDVGPAAADFRFANTDGTHRYIVYERTSYAHFRSSEDNFTVEYTFDSDHLADDACTDHTTVDDFYAEADGTLHVIYSCNKGMSSEQLIYGKRTSGTWTFSEIYSGRISIHASMAIDKDGNAHLAYAATTPPTVYYSTNTSGSFVETSQFFSAGPSSVSTNVLALVDKDLTAYVIYAFSDGISEEYIRYRTKPDGGGFSGDTTIVTQTTNTYWLHTVATQY